MWSATTGFPAPWFFPAIEDENKRQEELDKLNATQEEWKLRAMGTTIGCHTIVKKGTEGNSIKTYDLTWFLQKKKSPYELWVLGGLGGSLLSMLNRATITLHHRILPDQILIYILFSSNQVLSCKYVWLHHKSIQKLGNSTMLFPGKRKTRRTEVLRVSYVWTQRYLAITNLYSDCITRWL